MNPFSGHLLLAQAALLESYGQALPKTESSHVEALAAALAASPGWPSGCGAVLVVRREPTPALSVLGCFSQEGERWLRGQIRALHKACGTLRYVDPAQVEADCRKLAGELRARLGAEGLDRASWTGIPRGGLTVLDILADHLGIQPSQMRPPFPADRPLVVVDDCALSGARFHQFLRQIDHPSIVFATLYSHPELRAAICLREPRVAACVSAQDLGGRRIEDCDAADAFYWSGEVEALCFPWNEPDRLFRSSATGPWELAWRIVPPELCAKNRPAPGTEPVPIQLQPTEKGPRERPVLTAMRTRRLYGLLLASDFPWAAHCGEESSRDSPDLTFSVSRRAPASPLWQQTPPVYTSPWQTENGESASLLYRTPGFEVLRFPGLFDFYLWTDRIVCHLLDPGSRLLVEIRLLGPVLAYWLERRGMPALHASAVAIDRRAAAFLSTHGAGKSGLAAALMCAGASLLTDDVFPLEERDGAFLGRPGYPQMRMWPDEATWFLGGCEGLPLVHPGLSKRRLPVGPDGFGTFCDDPLPLTCLYLPDRQPDGDDAPIDIREISPRDALIELLRHSFTPLLVEAAGLQPARFDLLSRLVLQIPVKRLRYPSGFDRLPWVAEAVRRDLERC